MKFILTSLVVVGVAFWLLWPATEVENYPASGTDIIAFGDSLIAGVGATEGNDMVSILERQIGEPIINLGVPGDTTADGLARLDELDNYDPKVVVLLLGGNDAIQRVPIEETFQNLALIIEDLQSRGAVVVLLGVRSGILGDAFDTEFEQLAREYNTVYVSDVLAGVLGRPALMADAVQPNDAGYAQIADRIMPELRKVID
jgi:lysophospholipase L1-like esterase